MDEFQPGVIVGIEELNAHARLLPEMFWRVDMAERHAAMAGKRIRVRLVGSDENCMACGAPYCEVEKASALAAMPGWTTAPDGESEANGAGLCSTLVRTD